MIEELRQIYERINNLYKEKGIIPEGTLTFILPEDAMFIPEISIAVDVSGRIGTLKITLKQKPLQIDHYYTGSICKCGSHRMLRRGSCETCEECGESSSCG